MRYTKIDRDVLIRHPANPILRAEQFQEQLGFKMRAVYNCSAVKVAEGRSSIAARQCACSRDRHPVDGNGMGEPEGAQPLREKASSAAPLAPVNEFAATGPRYVMLCRTNELNAKTLLWGADSTDGVRWRLRPEPFEVPDTDWWREAASTVYYDPRITFIDGEWKVLVACQSTSECRVALFVSKDLASLRYVNWICAPDNRNMVLFPERSQDGRYLRLERPNLPGSGKGDIWLSHSPDLIHWGDSHRVLATSEVWNYGISGVGASTVPYRTPEGWLILFHAIMGNCTTKEYAVGAALLDLEKPWIVRHATRYPILYPQASYEITGLVEHVCFPCSKIVEPDGSVKVYYGAADMVQCLATGTLADLIHACKHW